MSVAEFRMPSLGADMEAGTLVEWLVHAGDAVRKGDVVAVVDTAKANVEVESFASGVVERLIVQPGTRVPVGTVLATIMTGGEAAELVSPPAAGAEAAGAPAAGAQAVTAAPGGAPAPGAVPAPGGIEPAAPQPLAVGAGLRPEAVVPPAPSAVFPPEEARVTSPLVRRLAAQRHVDLAAVRGTGPGGRITHADVDAAAVRPRRVRSSPLARRLAAGLGVDLLTVRTASADGVVHARDVQLAAAAHPSEQPAERAADRSAAMRAQIAVSMARSKREIPHYYLSETLDVNVAMRWLRERNRELPVPQRIVPAALLLKAAALALHEVPDLNGHVIDGAFHRADSVHLGVAVSLRGGGLVAPAIHDADRLPLGELMTALKDLVARTRAGRLRAAELADPTITVSNLGEQGVESILGVIYPPQVALVGFGAIADRPWAVGGLIGVRPLVVASLAGDHRVTDGATGARYLLTIRQLLDRPEEL